MCSFIVTNKKIEDLSYVNYFTKFRGPDKTVFVEKNEYCFVHNILSITGDFITQPFEKDQIVCVYNGEIYNYKEFGDYKSDGECLIPLYEKYGDDFVKHLDGEFAIVLIDFSNNKLIISTDVFATKPLWFSFEEKIGFATYESCLKRLNFKSVEKMKANQTRVYSLDDKKLVKEFEIYTFDLNQYKTTFDDWTRAFENSIRKRTSNVREGIFIGLSSGYDSGAISCELNNQNVPYKAFSVIGKENNVILQKRANKLNKNSSIQFLNDDRYLYKNYINKNVEEFKYKIYSSSSNYNEFDRRLQDDDGSCGLSLVCHNANKQNLKIYISGSGADEIFSDYGFKGRKIFQHSNFGGLFPSKLETIFPWASFYESSMLSYLAKEEYVAGSYGIETRYPYLDKYVIQEFLWLHENLKNNEYKAPLNNYLMNNNYPYEKGEKRGF